MKASHSAAALFLTVACATAAFAQPGAETVAQRMAVQRDAMAKLASMDGTWRGPAVTTLPNGQKHEIIQTERIGSFLDGTVKVLEGRGFEPDGKVSFNAFGTISYNTTSKAYTLHSYAMGQVGDFALVPNADGYVWEIPAGPVTIRYTMIFKNGTWREVGDRLMQGKEPVRFFEMNLKRVGDTDWPAAGAMTPK
jgi:hypothetical protein